MNDPSPMSDRERRALLWLCVGAISWRWLVAMRTPMPGLDACSDLWLAGQLAHGHFAALATGWWRCAWALLLTPMLACGLSPFFAAHLLAAVVGGLVVWPVAAAAQRLREGAGLPAAAIAAVAAGPVLAAGAGAATDLVAVVVAAAALAAVRARWWVAVTCGGIAVAFGGDQLREDVGGFLVQLRTAGGPALLLLPFALLAPRPPRARALWLTALLVGLVAVGTGSWATLVPSWSPVIAILGGLGLARLGAVWRELLLCAVVGLDFLTAWQRVEAPAAGEERWLGAYLAHTFGGHGELVGDLPRVAWAFGSRPHRHAADELVAAAARPETAVLVLGPGRTGRATLRAAVATQFVAAKLSGDANDAAATVGATVLVRR